MKKVNHGGLEYGIRRGVFCARLRRDTQAIAKILRKEGYDARAVARGSFTALETDAPDDVQTEAMIKVCGTVKIGEGSWTVKR